MRKRAFIIIFLQSAVLLTLIASILYRLIPSPWTMELPLEDFFSSYAVYDGNSITLDSKNASGIISKGTEVIVGPYLNLKPDSYTLLIDYEVDEEQPCIFLSTENYHSLRGNSFTLSPFHTQLSYDFYCPTLSKGINIQFLYSGNGGISLKNVTVAKNNHNLQILLFMWISISIGFDLFLFSNIWKKHKVTILTIVTISFLASIPLLAEGMYPGHDYYFHQMRIEGIMKGLLNGEFPVRIESSFNSGYGLPVSIFYGSSLLYIAALFRIIGFSVTTSFKLFIIVINILTSLAAYLCCKCIFKKRETSYLVSATYVLSSYRLVDIYVRSAVGEYCSFIFFPLIALSIWIIYTTDVNHPHYYFSILPLTFGMLGLIYNHLLSLEMAGIILICLAILFYKKTFRKETLLVYIISFILFLIGAAAFYIPFIDYYLHTDIIVKHFEAGSIQNNGAWLSDYFAFFKNPLGHATQFIVERLSLTPGFPLMVGLFAAIHLVVSKNANSAIKKLLIFSIGCLYLASTAFPWDFIAQLPFLGTIFSSIQFPFRYLGFAVLFLSLLLGHVFDWYTDSSTIHHRSLLAFCFLIFFAYAGQFASVFFDNAVHVIHSDTEELPSYTFYNEKTQNADDYFCAGGEYNLIGSHRPDPSHFLSTENAAAEILSEHGLSMTIRVNANANAFVEIPRFNYPYYRVKDEQGMNFPIKSGDNNKIRLSFSQPYNGTLHISFSPPWYWKLSEMITFLFFALSGILFFLRRKWYHRRTAP